MFWWFEVETREEKLARRVEKKERCRRRLPQVGTRDGSFSAIIRECTTLEGKNVAGQESPQNRRGRYWQWWLTFSGGKKGRWGNSELGNGHRSKSLLEV